MLRILVCFKVVPEYEHLKYEEIDKIIEGTFDFRYVKRIISMYDEAALEFSLRLKEAAENDSLEITALTVGECSRTILKELKALGIDNVVKLQYEDSNEDGTLSIAQLLIRFFQQEGPFDLILTGQKADDQNTGRLPGYLSAALDIPLIERVSDLSIESDGIMAIDYSNQMGQNRIHAHLPLVCSMENAVHPYLRLAKLKDKIAVGKWEPTTVGFDMEVKASGWKLDAQRHAKERKACQMILKNSEEEYAAFLLENLL